MKMAKASQADLDMLQALHRALDAITARWSATIPPGCIGADGQVDAMGEEEFDLDDAEQCQRVLRHIIDITERGSFFRCVGNLLVLLDPTNPCVDPAADTLEAHPRLLQLDKLEKLVLELACHGHFDHSTCASAPVAELMAKVREALGMTLYEADSTEPAHG